MAKIFSAPSSIPLPQWSIKKTHQENMAEEKTYLETLKDMLIKRKPTQKLVGEIIKFPMADGYAEYMVASTTPLELVHIPLGDAWDFQYAHRLTKKDVEEKIKNQKALDELFKKK
jgi:hypothetical protein